MSGFVHESKTAEKKLSQNFVLMDVRQRVPFKIWVSVKLPKPIFRGADLSKTSFTLLTCQANLHKFSPNANHRFSRIAEPKFFLRSELIQKKVFAPKAQR